jgi:hypothetical protein
MSETGDTWISIGPEPNPDVKNGGRNSTEIVDTGKWYYGGSCCAAVLSAQHQRHCLLMTCGEY